MLSRIRHRFVLAQPVSVSASGALVFIKLVARVGEETRELVAGIKAEPVTFNRGGVRAELLAMVDVEGLQGVLHTVVLASS